MSKMLDLSVFQEETFDIKFSEDDILHVKKPTEQIAIKILAHVNAKNNDMTPEEMLSMTRDMTLSILNHNADNRKFDNKFVKDKLPLNMQIAIIKGYTEFMVEMENNPN